MKILYLLQDLPYPPTNGVRVKLFNLISYMAKNHECHILSFGDNDLHAREFQQKVPEVRILNLLPLCSGLKLQMGRLAHLMRGEPVFLARWDDKAFAKKVKEALGATYYDVVHLDALGVAPYVYLCQSVPTVISTTDAVSLAYKRAAIASRCFWRKSYRLLASRSIARFERNILPLFSKVHVVSKLERDYLSAHVPGSDVECIEHVVSDDILRYPNRTSCSLSDNKRILFTGALSAENIAGGLLAFLSIDYPIICQKCPDVEMIILGRNAPVKLRERIINITGIRFLEWVEDYCAELMKSDVIVFLDRSGTGVKTRVLYALGLGKAVVASSVSLEGIEVRDGTHCFEREVGVDFAEAVISLLNNPELLRKMGQNAKRLIHDKYSIKIAGPKWVKLYESAISKNLRKTMCSR